MPLVAPVWGISTPPRGSAFIRVCKLSGRPLESIDGAPLLMAPTPEGGWSSRSTTTSEAGKWLRHILSRMEGTLDHTTAHTLKGTPLSWCAKFGIDPDTRLLLGHHSTGKVSAECYGRDNLAKPLRWSCHRSHRSGQKHSGLMLHALVCWVPHNGKIP